MKRSRNGFLVALCVLAAVGGHPRGAHAQAGSAVWIGAGWLSPDGEIRLVRGDRKVVTNQIDAAPVIDVGVETRFGPRWGGVVSVVVGSFDHTHVESFTEGAEVSSVNAARYVGILAGPSFTLLDGQRLRFSAGMQLSYNIYGGDFEITGEREVPPGGVGPPNLSVGGWTLRNDFRGGLSLSADVTVSDRIGLVLMGRRIVTDFGADIVDDPEDDGQDVDLDFDPLGLSLGIRLSM